MMKTILLGVIVSFLSATFIPSVDAAPKKSARATRSNNKSSSRKTYRSAKSLPRSQRAPVTERDEQGRRVVYQKTNVVDFDAMMLEGDVRNPNEFYFVHRPEEKFGSLVKQRPNFHKEMLRDAVMVK